MTLMRRFLSKIKIRCGGCWVWNGVRIPSGYGQIYVDGKMVLAHRFMYELVRGPIPEKKFVCHACDNPSCVNPSHLWLGTPADNMHDRDSKDRTSKGEHRPQHKITGKDATLIRTLAAEGESRRALGKRFGISHPMVCAIVNRKRWKHVP